MGKRKKEPRTYDSSGRRQRAQETRERMLEAARRLFAERGYAETTIEAIAAQAGVAVPTVYAAFQSKRGVLSALMRRLVSGEEGGPPLLRTAGPQAVLAEPNPRRALALFVDHLTQVQERAIPTYEAMKGAARSEPGVAELLGRMQAYRFSNIATIPARLAELGALRPGLSEDDASRTIWALASPEVRQMLQTFAGWSADRYRAWLVETLGAALLSPSVGASAGARGQPPPRRIRSHSAPDR
jgi:AcrR family transcriptional regulator